MATEEIQLGDIAKDMVTGFTGVVVATTQWLHGCARLTLQPRELQKDGKVIEPLTFDLNQLTLVKSGAVPVTAPATKSKPVTGGPRPEPAQKSGPAR